MDAPTIDIDTCVGCGACADACPCDVLEVVDGHSTVTDADACIQCASCVDACPTGAIKLED